MIQDIVFRPNDLVIKQTQTYTKLKISNSIIRKGTFIRYCLMRGVERRSQQQ